MKTPLVSVVIPTFNASRTLAETLASVRAQTFGAYEVLLVDDASTDDTVSVAKSESSHLSNCRIIASPENHGASAARNRGVEAAQGSYIAFLDADDLWQPEKLSRQVDILKQNPEVGAVHCGADLMDVHGRPMPVPARARKQQLNGKVFEEFFMTDISLILTSTVLIRRECFRTVGMFDESGDVVDDHDFFLRLAWEYPIWYLEDPLVRYRVIKGSLSRQNSIRRIRQHEQTLRKCIAVHPEFFAERPSLVAQRWRQFHRWAGMMLFYAGEYRESRRHLRKTLSAGPLAWKYYAATFIPSRLLTHARSKRRLPS
jgi:glycosyltransferase involved in cell wall biosynthesis